MHLADFWPGPVWLYAAPGSGVWWTAGRHVVALNLVAALLHFMPLSKVVAHLSLVRNGDRRYSARLRLVTPAVLPGSLVALICGGWGTRTFE